MTEFFESSTALKDYLGNLKKAKHPWDQLECGKSFVVQKSEGRLETLRASASKWGKKLQRKFLVVEHDGLFEIGRVK